MRQTRTPVVFMPHGGGPWPFVDTGFPRDELASLASYLRSIPALFEPEPRALLVVSGHWEEPLPTVMTAAQPPLYYDYSGFPPESYTLTWPAPGAPALATRVRTLLTEGGFSSAADPVRGFDHGTFIPLKVAWPEPTIPTVQLSLLQGLDPRQHLALGRALQPLRDEGVAIIASGLSFHNLRALVRGDARDAAATFDDWLQATVVQPEVARDNALALWASAPGARVAHPREEHLMPLLVAAGAAGADVGRVAWTGTTTGHRHSAVHFGEPRDEPGGAA